MIKNGAKDNDPKQVSKKKEVNGQVRRPLTAAQKARDKATREAFRHKPTMEELLATGDWEGPYNHGDILNLLQVAGTLRQARLDSGHSLASVARESGIDSAALCRLEKGDNWNPTIDTLRRWARALGRRILMDVALEQPERKGKQTLKAKSRK